MRIVYTLLILCTHHIFGVSLSTHPVDDTHLNITIQMEASADACVYKDYINISVDNPAIQIGSWRSNVEPISAYDATFKETKLAFNKPFTIEISAERTDTQPLAQPVHLHISYYDAAQKKMVEDVLPICMPKHHAEVHHAAIAQAIDVYHAVTPEPVAEAEPAPAPATAAMSWSAYIAHLIQTTDSLWIRILLVLMLGLLMSLTPCIYPMLPITMGILNAQGNVSVLRNFLGALAYITGIATTFACLGLLAAFTGHIFGTIMQNPFVIITLVALLLYLAGSMLGLYEMYIPRFMQTNAHAQKGGSLLSAFLFGAMSGTVASPCLSPGLLLLLSIVTAVGNIFIGFVLLFAFGIGLGIPLLILGTFSGSLNVLPRAGMWMIEVKKIFGLIMIGICFYFLHNIMPWHLLITIMTISTLIAGIFYLASARTTKSTSWRLINNIFGIALIALSTLLAGYTFTTWQQQSTPHKSMWLTDYQKALALARAENKKLFIDIGAPFCSICDAINKKMLHTPEIENVLNHNFISVKIDGSDEKNNDITQQFDVKGFPTILIIDPASQEIIKRWGSELYDVELATFAQELQTLAMP